MVDDAKSFASNYISGILFTSLARDRCLKNKIGRFLSQALHCCRCRQNWKLYQTALKSQLVGAVAASQMLAI